MEESFQLSVDMDAETDVCQLPILLETVTTGPPIKHFTTYFSFYIHTSKSINPSSMSPEEAQGS